MNKILLKKFPVAENTCLFQVDTTFQQRNMKSTPTSGCFSAELHQERLGNRADETQLADTCGPVNAVPRSKLSLCYTHAHTLPRSPFFTDLPQSRVYPPGFLNPWKSLSHLLPPHPVCMSPAPQKPTPQASHPRSPWRFWNLGKFFCSS